MGNWTLRDFDGQNRLVRETRPEGNRVEYAYEDATCPAGAGYLKSCTHNVVTVTKYPRPGTSDPVLAQRFTYNAAYGKVATATDAKRQVTTYAYEAGGHLHTITRPPVGGGRSGQMRLYGDSGAPLIDLDFDHLHLGMKPHAHNWNGAVRDGGTDVVPFSPWKP
ncbi:hypothetical protein V4C53_45220 [Paraburkholderia azotifigens]|uniref:hypothetical protein n=1 Tax=Paraburkholderia azotifigens TaxID=2057004 RepID=UPI00316C53CE